MVDDVIDRVAGAVCTVLDGHPADADAGTVDAVASTQ
jgi:hypothetical protein